MYSEGNPSAQTSTLKILIFFAFENFCIFLHLTPQSTCQVSFFSTKKHVKVEN